jgi:hypothetical protein
MNDLEILEARQRANEWRENIEEYCPHGGALFGKEEVWLEENRNRQH